MDPAVRNRLEVVWQKLEVGLCHTGSEDPCGRRRDVNARGILKKWRFRSRMGVDRAGGPWNRFLPRNLQRLTPLYDDMVEIASQESHGARLRDLQGLLDRCSGIQEGSASVVADWDDQWINALSLASKGWGFTSVDEHGRLVCQCSSCRRTMVLDLGFDQCSPQYLRQSYWVNGVSRAHETCCPWRDAQFDLEKEYYLRSSNLVYDIERIKRELEKSHSLPESKSSHEYLSADQLTRLKQVFRYQGDAQLLELLLRGFQPTRQDCDIVKCSACFRKVFTHKCSELNYHESWCRYHQEHKLPEMILSSLSLDYEGSKEPDSVVKRLHKLETYLEDL